MKAWKAIIPLLCLFAASSPRAQLPSINLSVGSGGGSPTPPSYVGAVQHRWTPSLGGGLWYQEGAVINAIAPALEEYSRPILVGLRSDRAENGYRFDLDTFAPDAPSYTYWEDRYSQEKVLQQLEAHNTEFMWSIPVPSTNLPAAYNTAGAGYPWQTAAYYAAYAQYLLAPTTMTPAEYNALPVNLNFFTDDTCTTTNAASETAVHGNWANLRARRGHTNPYRIQSAILGIEPYAEAQEHFVSDGARYGTAAEAYRVAIRARGGPLQTLPLGLCITEGGAISDFERPWFKPMLDNTTHSDFSILDLHHHYRFGSPGDELNRIYPILVNTGSPTAASPGWQNWWLPRDQWVSDFSRYLWGFEDSRKALALYGENTNRWKTGTSEHGMSITSKFSGNDMGGAIHWALWLAEVMRYNVNFDLNWVLAEQGYAHAQLQYRDSRLTRTPGHYAYKMAQEFSGLDYLTNSFQSPTSTVGKTGEGGNYKADDIIMRIFRDPATTNYHLFIVNKSAAAPFTLSGWDKWNLRKWDRLSALTFTNQNTIGEPWTHETVKTVTINQPGGQPIVIPAISVNHLEFSATPNTLPLVTVENHGDAKELPSATGKFRVTRTKPTSQPLTVNYHLSGTATTADYTVTVGTTNSITIPSGAATIDLEIHPISDGQPENPEYVNLHLQPGNNYIVANPNAASVYITD